MEAVGGIIAAGQEVKKEILAKEIFFVDAFFPPGTDVIRYS
jgi:hypothetical protein